MRKMWKSCARWACRSENQSVSLVTHHFDKIHYVVRSYLILAQLQLQPASPPKSAHTTTVLCITGVHRLVSVSINRTSSVQINILITGDSPQLSRCRGREFEPPRLHGKSGSLANSGIPFFVRSFSAVSLPCSLLENPTGSNRLPSH